MSLLTFCWVHSNSKEVPYLSWQNKYSKILKTTRHIKPNVFLWTELLENSLLAKSDICCCDFKTLSLIFQSMKNKQTNKQTKKIEIIIWVHWLLRPWFFKSFISLKILSINSCYLIKSFSFPLYTISLMQLS